MFVTIAIAIFILLAVVMTSGFVAYPLVWLFQRLFHRLPGTS